MSDALRPVFSVIVPTLDEEGWVESTLQIARSALREDCELLVVDGGSTDATRVRAARHARILSTDACRGRQLGVGARAATGDVLVFVHADTRLTPDTGRAILDALVDPSVIGGCCRFGVFPAPGRFDRFRLLEWGVNFRTRLLRSATGDQVIFVRREAYHRAGGYPEIPAALGVSGILANGGTTLGVPSRLLARCLPSLAGRAVPLSHRADGTGQPASRARVITCDTNQRPPLEVVTNGTETLPFCVPTMSAITRIVFSSPATFRRRSSKD